MLLKKSYEAHRRADFWLEGIWGAYHTDMFVLGINNENDCVYLATVIYINFALKLFEDLT